MNKWDDSGLFPWEDDVPASPVTPPPADPGAAATHGDGDLSRSPALQPDGDMFAAEAETATHDALPETPPSAGSGAAVTLQPEAEPPPRAEAQALAEPESRVEQEVRVAPQPRAEPESRAEPPARAEPPPRAEPPAQTRPLVRKEYYAISEVSDLVGLPAHVLRYWESQFSVLNPSKNRSGNRVYQRKEIKLILLVKQLLHEEKYTVEGAKQKLDQLRRGGDMADATRHALDEQMVRVLREDLTALGELLKLDGD
jgi:DNA-binding transcriptional MerR regulator